MRCIVRYPDIMAIVIHLTGCARAPIPSRRLSACHNVLFTGHQAFLTREALHAKREAEARDWSVGAKV